MDFEEQVALFTRVIAPMRRTGKNTFYLCQVMSGMSLVAGEQLDDSALLAALCALGIRPTKARDGGLGRVALSQTDWSNYYSKAKIEAINARLAAKR